MDILAIINLFGFHFIYEKNEVYILQGKRGIDSNIFCWMAFISQFACTCIAVIAPFQRNTMGKNKMAAIA